MKKSIGTALWITAGLAYVSVMGTVIYVIASLLVAYE